MPKSIQQAKRPHLWSVISKPNADVIQTLEVLLDEAKKGNLTGIVFGCTLQGHKPDHFVTDVAGNLAESPTIVRGIIAYLGDQVARLQHEQQNLAP